MQFIGLSVILVLPLLLLLALLIRLALPFGWVFGWLRGNLLLGLLVLLLAGAATVWELQTFRPLLPDQQIMQVQISQLEPQRYRLLLAYQGKQQQVDVQGELWEMDVQLIRWGGVLAALGLDDGYRPYRLRGRFLSLEEQQRGATNQALKPVPVWRDAWHWLEASGGSRLISADAFTLGFMPLADGAEFGIRIGVTGLTPEPLNTAAIRALRYQD